MLWDNFAADLWPGAVASPADACFAIPCYLTLNFGTPDANLRATGAAN